MKSLIKSKKSPLPLSTTPSSKKDKLLSKHDLLSDSIISVGARSKFQPAALAEQQPCTSNIDRISLGKSTSPFKATSPTYSSALIKCTNGSAQGIKSFGGGGGGGTTSSKKSSSSLHNLTSGSGISKQHNRDKSINGGGIGLFRTMSGGRNSITDGFPSKRNSLTLSAAPPQRKRSDTSSFTPSEIVVERQEDNDEEEEEEGYEEVVVVKRVGSGGGKGMTLSASARSGLKGGTGMSLLETSDLIEEVYEE